MLEPSLRTCFWHMSQASGDVQFLCLITTAVLACLNDRNGRLSIADHLERSHVYVKHQQNFIDC